MLDFFKVITKTSFCQKCWWFMRYDQKRFFIVIIKNLLLPKMLIVYEIGPKKIFFIVIIRKDHFALKLIQVLLILAVVWAKNDFFIMITKNLLLLEMLIVHEIWAKTIFHSDHKKGPFARNDYCFRHMAKNDFFKISSKKLPFA